ncbi:MAG: SET domain-containing protein-lysine N-methyltransferase [Candidatus Gracilibacteria bacterium]|nr:SET domain-containing protein-lysine N-methyltransferase [Candidatus Gracilibacteria bacterium]
MNKPSTPSDSEEYSIKNEYIPHSQDNQNISVKTFPKIGRSVYANKQIKKGETIAQFNGKKIVGFPITELPNEAPDYLRDHVIQTGEFTYLHGKNGLAELLNHSCDPNCGITGDSTIVAIKTILPDEELNWDYAMTEDSNWYLENCQCGSDKCRGTIGPYRDLPQETKKSYWPHTATWLQKKYPENNPLHTSRSNDYSWNKDLRIIHYPDTTVLANDTEMMEKLARMELITWGLEPFNEYAYCVDKKCGTVIDLTEAYPEFKHLKKNYKQLIKEFPLVTTLINNEELRVPPCPCCNGQSELICGPDSFIPKLKKYFKNNVFGVIAVDKKDDIQGFANAMLSTRSKVFHEVINYRGGYNYNDYIRNISSILKDKTMSDGSEEIVYWNKIALTPPYRGGKSDYFGWLRRELLELKPEYDDLPLTGDTRFDTKVYSLFKGLGYQDVVQDPFGHVIHVFKDYKKMRKIAQMSRDEFTKTFGKTIKASQEHQKNVLEPQIDKIKKAYQDGFDNNISM